jgi:D-glycero-D-manno-heptose 1,7-bisphosphate phosphatase
MKLVILDRDGVINKESDAFIKSPQEWVPLPGSLEAIARLTKAGYTVVVASNQSGIGRGLFTAKTLEDIHEHMKVEVTKAGGKIDSIFICPHKPEDNCDCRKPKPGLFHRIMAYYVMPMRGVPAIGDSLRDLEAARAAGARPILVRTGRGEITLKELGANAAFTEVYPNLNSVVTQLLSELH